MNIILSEETVEVLRQAKIQNMEKFCIELLEKHMCKNAGILFIKKRERLDEGL